MDEHDDDLASEVIEGEEIETDAFEVEDDDDARNAENLEDSEDDDASTEDDSEI